MWSWLGVLRAVTPRPQLSAVDAIKTPIQQQDIIRVTTRKALRQLIQWSTSIRIHTEKTIWVVLDNLYRCDKLAAAKRVAVMSNITINYSIRQDNARKETAARKRKWRRSLGKRGDADNPKGPSDKIPRQNEAQKSRPERQVRLKQPFLLKKKVNMEIKEDEEGTTKWYTGVIIQITDGMCTISFDEFDSSHNIEVTEDEVPSEDIILL
ncbi:hypothetical protein ACROYT_G015364 [Oculina patagonica]